MLQDLDISGKRKGGSWWRQWFEPYGTADYGGITAEWLEKNKNKTEDGNFARFTPQLGLALQVFTSQACT